MKILPIYNFSETKKKLNVQPKRQNINFQKTNCTAKNLQPVYFLNFYPSFKAIRFVSIDKGYKPQEQTLKSEVETFSKTQSNVELLGDGLSAQAYTFDNLPGVVIKKPFSKSETFADEERNITLVPERIKNSQRFVARAYDDSKGFYYLLTTKVEGHSPDPATTPLTRQHLKSLFDTMFEFDKVGLYHGDLNQGNMKLTDDGNVNFLDYQWATKVSENNFFDDTKVGKQSLPRFIHCENAQMFEMAELPYYLKGIGDKDAAKNFLIMYLQEKAKYHVKRVYLLQEKVSKWPYPYEVSDIQNGIRFEKAQSIVLANPTEDVLKLECKKIQFLNSFREAYKRVDENVEDKNILMAPAAYLFALNSVQDFRCEIARQKKNVNSQATLDYLKGQEEYGNYWLQNLTDWTQDTFNFPIRHITKRLESWEKSLYNFNNQNADVEFFGGMTNVIEGVDEKYLPNYARNFSTIKTSKVQSAMQQITTDMEGFGKYVTSTPQTLGIKSAQKKLKKAYSILNRAYQSNWGLDVINASLLTALRASQIEDEASENSNLMEFDKKHMADAKKAASALKAKSIELATLCFNGIFNEIKENGISSYSAIGYKNMGNFG